MYSATDDDALPSSGFPIRRSAGQWLFSASPRLIAAVHVLHRLLVPRHPPSALTILTDDRGRRSQSTAYSEKSARISPVANRPEGDQPLPVTLATVQFSRSAKR